MWSTFSFAQHSGQLKGILPLSAPLCSIFYISYGFIPHLCWANTLVCLQFKPFELVIKLNGRTCGQYIPLGRVEFYYLANRVQPKQHPYELCTCVFKFKAQDTCKFHDLIKFEPVWEASALTTAPSLLP